MVTRSSHTLVVTGMSSPLKPACSLVTQLKVKGHRDWFRAPEVLVLLPWVSLLSPEAADPEILPLRAEKEIQESVSLEPDSTVGTWSSISVATSGHSEGTALQTQVKEAESLSIPFPPTMGAGLLPGILPPQPSKLPCAWAKSCAGRSCHSAFSCLQGIGES